MSSKADSEKQKLIQDKCQVILGNLLREEDNKYCVDCDAKGPRWASWNLGIFLCIRCAGIHRNLGVHISKVKSVNLDTWTPEQVACLQQMGNSQARAVYEANLPENFRRPQTDSSLEAFIRAKYEQKKYIAKEWVPPPAPPPAFDIEEEKRKERERKKNKNKPLPQHPTAVPRPHSAGPHSPAIQPEASKQMQQVPDSSDLLNLGDANYEADDSIFDAFLSATSTVSGKAPTNTESLSNGSAVSKNSVANDETDFFNQKVLTDSSKSNKMTKESILSLYGSNTVQIPPSQHIAPVYGVPGGMFIGQQGYAQVGMTGYPSVPAQAVNPCNTGANMPTVYNPFASIGATAIRQDTRNQPNMWIGVSPGGRDESLLMAHGMGQVSQQMANLQLSGQAWNMSVSAASVNAPGMVIGTNQAGSGVVWPPSSQNQNFSNNLWQ